MNGETYLSPMMGDAWSPRALSRRGKIRRAMACLRLLCVVISLFIHHFWNAMVYSSLFCCFWLQPFCHSIHREDKDKNACETWLRISLSLIIMMAILFIMIKLEWSIYFEKKKCEQIFFTNNILVLPFVFILHFTFIYYSLPFPLEVRRERDWRRKLARDLLSRVLT